ncbi:ferredoxin [Streptomyces spectabilis]|uniref:Ferredoxin n=1 Tax=Streptomyces spectabilis TaxID=68270 RepID=A0A5P2XLD4_STRST|nr:ferredoxin [Streptomyces spectabilis]MBB5105303.1 ferredoxin [Streptomyces spectabilis]MCI3906497.1 ferredoxin [Streptomyces spectabilis]QEV63336.1 ferredoxin [Streptomyces spectabilis]GGV20881.1 ferredoxin [Streptomyces spectabilis]
MRIIADADKCVGSGQCVFTEPDLFDQSEDEGTVVVLNAEPEGELLERGAREAVDNCPGQALSLTE